MSPEQLEIATERGAAAAVSAISRRRGFGFGQAERLFHTTQASLGVFFSLLSIPSPHLNTYIYIKSYTSIHPSSKSKIILTTHAY
ncbi:hypothetical protein KSP40_PGU012626 [Platanthera guangdongensis]|uniref:Uncharacterized protein n=1 Tax=Platanthera guangdongensis TaxID=2320717 RepID=A0ABR2M9H0_9ASPA